MAKYRLLKDLPYARAGEVFERNTHKSKDGLSDYDYLEIKKRVKVGEDEVSFGIKYNYFLDNFDKWFEEIQEESTDSIHWKPRIGEKCWSFLADGEVVPFYWSTLPYDLARYEMGNIYRTKKECEKARDRELTEVRLRRTSTFEPDLKSGMYAYTVGYNFKHKRLYVTKLLDVIIGNSIIYKSLEEAEKSIEENREDWMIYFGVKEEK